MEGSTEAPREREEEGATPAGPPTTALEDLTTEVVGTLEGIRALGGDYEQLYRASGNTLPFALQEWHLAWCRHFLNLEANAEDRVLFHVLRKGSECVGIVPFILTRRRVRGLRIRTVALLGSDQGLSEIRNPLIKAGYEQAVVRAVHASLVRNHEWDWVQWHRVSLALADALDREAQPHWYDATDDYVLDLPASWEALRATLSRNLKESLRHCYNSLRRAGHTFEFLVARERAELGAALHRFLELHSLRAAAADGPLHPNRFAGRALQDFLYEVCDRLADRDAVRVYQLRIGSDIVASRVGFVVNGSVYLYYSGFDPAWAHHGVMTTTVAEAIKYSIAEGIKSVNLSPHGEQSKLRWRPRLVVYPSALVQRENLTSRILCRTYRVALSNKGTGAKLLRGLFWPHRNWD
jgi:CelD/BcsL family acetyltransferase involved in cellulose biosynthesis